MRLYKKTLIFSLIAILNIMFSSCTSFKAGLYLISIDENKGDDFIRDEPLVRVFMEEVINFHEDYTIRAFARIPIHYQFKRTRLMTHYFYVITHKDGSYNTLSFYGTDFTFNSKGVWALNTDSDLASYEMYLSDNNRWDVEGLFPGHVISARKVSENVIEMIDKDTPFFYRDHMKDKKNANNCITALTETIAFE